MSGPRTMRPLVLAEVAAVVALAFVPWPEALPVALPLFAIASILRWTRGRSWGEVVTLGRLQVIVGALVGVASLGAALVAGDPVASALTGKAVEWSTAPIVRGNTTALAGALVLVASTSICMELGLRGWIVERARELEQAPVVAILVGAFAEALITPGGLEVRLGAALMGIGLGWLYLAGGRNALAPILARVVFGGAAIVLQALQLIG